MSIQLGFLRAINLGAKRKFPKDAIKAAVEAAGFDDVATYINTGNIRFSTSMRSRARIEAALEQAFLADRDFEVPTIVFTATEFARIGADAEELGDPRLSRHYVTLLKDEPSAAKAAEIEALSTDQHRVVVRHRAAHLLLGEGYQDGNVDPLRVEKRLEGVVTNRNATVIKALAQLWC